MINLTPINLYNIASLYRKKQGYRQIVKHETIRLVKVWLKMVIIGSIVASGPIFSPMTDYVNDVPSLFVDQFLAQQSRFNIDLPSTNARQLHYLKNRPPTCFWLLSPTWGGGLTRKIFQMVFGNHYFVVIFDHKTHFLFFECLGN